MLSCFCLCLLQHPSQPESQRVFREGGSGGERQRQLLGCPPGLRRRLLQGRLSQAAGTSPRTRQRKWRERQRTAVRLPLQSGVRADDAASDGHRLSPIRLAVSGRRRRHCADAGLQWHHRKFDGCERSRHARRTQRDGIPAFVPRPVPIDVAIVSITHELASDACIASFASVHGNVEQSPAGDDAVDDVISEHVYPTHDTNILFGFGEHVRAL